MFFVICMSGWVEYCLAFYHEVAFVTQHIFWIYVRTFLKEFPRISLILRISIPKEGAAYKYKNRVPFKIFNN